MFSGFPKCVFKKTFLYNAFCHSSPPWRLQSYGSVDKRLGRSASQFASQFEELSLPFTDDCDTYSGEISQDKDHSTFKLDSSFHLVTLRDSCSCNCCINPTTSQKLFETADIPQNIQGQVSQHSPDGTITVLWQNDIPGYENHLSNYPSHFIKKDSSNLRAPFDPGTRPITRIPWNQEIMAAHSTPFDYNSFISSSSVLFRSLIRLHEVGLVFLRNVPSEPDAVNHIANRIGIIRNTVYGDTWNVRSLPSPKNVAYTSTHLGFHMVRGETICFRLAVAVTSYRICYI